MRNTVDRRKFLGAAGVTAAAAAAAGIGGELLFGKQFRRSPVASAPAAPASAAPATAKPPELTIDPMRPLAADETLNIPGLSPFFTPNKMFYRVDTALVVPQIAPRSWQLRIHGMVDKPMTLTYDDLIRMPMID